MTSDRSNDPGREGLVDPTTTASAVYSDEEREFMLAVDGYRRANRRPFPNWSEVLAVLKSLGYRRTEPAADLPRFEKGRTGFGRERIAGENSD